MRTGAGEVSMLMGLYPYIRRGENRGFKPSMLLEIKECPACNPVYHERMVFLAADGPTAGILRSVGLPVARTFEAAPDHVWTERLERVTKKLRFAHLGCGGFELAPEIRTAFATIHQQPEADDAV